MENNSPIDLKELWNRQPSPAPDKKDLFKKIDRLKASGLKKILLINICLGLTSAFIIFIWIYFQPQFLSTKIGIVLTILAMVIFLFMQNRSIPLYKKVNEAQSNNAYLSNLLAIKQTEQFLQTRLLNVYFVLLTLGIGLYMYEYTSRMSLPAGIAAYAITLAWMAFNWFVLRPKQIQKNKRKIEPVIQQLEEMKTRLKEDADR